AGIQQRGDAAAIHTVEEIDDLGRAVRRQRHDLDCVRADLVASDGSIAVAAHQQPGNLELSSTHGRTRGVEKSKSAERCQYGELLHSSFSSVVLVSLEQAMVECWIASKGNRHARGQY